MARIDFDPPVRPMPRAKYEVDHAFHRVESTLVDFEKDLGLNLLPDFQRGHVWTREQQERWIEAVLRGAISKSGLVIQFNAPTWDPLSPRQASDLAEEVVIVDGLQRLTAIRQFVAGDIQAFGYGVRAFDGSFYDVRRYHFTVAVHQFQTRAELLTYYLDLNTGGTPHAPAEIARVAALRDGAGVRPPRRKP